MVRANIQREVTVSPDFVSLYSNDTQVQVTPWDIRLIFGEISEISKAEQSIIRIKSTGEVRMSPQHAKRVAALLVKQIEFYESKVGAIPMPTD